MSLAGAAGCIWVMALINRAAAVAAVVIEVMIYLALRRRALHAAWGDLRYGALMSLVRAMLLRLRRLPIDPRNWRPHILVFAEDPHKRRDLLRFAAWLNQGRGILTVCHKLIASNMTHDDSKRTLERLIQRSRIDAETEVLQMAEGRTVQETIHEVSGDADLVFLGLQDVAPGQEEAYGDRLASLIGDLPTVILVRAAGPFAGRLIDG